MVRSIPQLEALRDEWHALAAGFQTPLLDHDWFVSCAEAFHRDGDLRVMTIRRGSELVGAAPLVREQVPGGRRLTLLGASRLYEPSGWLFADADALHQLASETVKLGDVMMLQRVPADSPMIGVLASLPRAVSLARGSSTALAVVVRSTWDEYYAALSSHITGNLRRLRRKAERVHGSVQVRHETPLPSQVDGLLEQVVKVEGSGWKGRAGSALSRRADLRDFFRRYAHRAAASGQLRVTTLSFGSETAAVELSVEAYRSLWQLKIGYSEALAGYYPGLQLTEASIRAVFERGLASYEFLGSAASWEERWSPEVRRFRMLAVYPLNPKGLVTGCRDAAGVLWRRAQTMGRRPALGGA